MEYQSTTCKVPYSRHTNTKLCHLSRCCAEDRVGSNVGGPKVQYAGNIEVRARRCGPPPSHNPLWTLTTKIPTFSASFGCKLALWTPSVHRSWCTLHSQQVHGFNLGWVAGYSVWDSAYFSQSVQANFGIVRHFQLGHDRLLVNPYLFAIRRLIQH